MNPIRLLNLGSIPSGQTQAVYHVLAERMDDYAHDTIVLCYPDRPYLCLGYHQVFGSIFDALECKRRGLPVYHRQIGGGATYLDKNQIFYQCIFHHSHMPPIIKDVYALSLAAPVMALRKLGLNAELRDTNEIEVDGKRIAGTGGGQIGEATVIVGNLLLDFDFDTMTAVWHTPSTAFRILAEKALRDGITSLHELQIKISMKKITNLLIESFSDTTGRTLVPDTLSIDEKKAIQNKTIELASSDFRSTPSPEPMHSLKISARSLICYGEAHPDGYDVKGSFWVREAAIQEAIIESVPARQWLKTVQKLQGTPFYEWKEKLELAE